jgi:hypothetical protein
MHEPVEPTLVQPTLIEAADVTMTADQALNAVEVEVVDQGGAGFAFLLGPGQVTEFTVKLLAELGVPAGRAASKGGSDDGPQPSAVVWPAACPKSARPGGPPVMWHEVGCALVAALFCAVAARVLLDAGASSGAAPLGVLAWVVRAGVRDPHGDRRSAAGTVPMTRMKMWM